MSTNMAMPYLTKNMLKPTGFEPSATEAPIRPDEWQKELDMYNPDEYGLILRLEKAVNRFNNNRKMHQDTRAVFEKLMIFGGFAQNHMFQGGMNKKQMQKEGMDKDEIEEATALFGVVETVSDALWKEQDEGVKSEWVVDFETLAKAFLSSEFLTHFDWYEQKVVATGCQVLRSFYNYLTVHPVCPEYSDQILAARAVCDLAEKELPKLAVIDRSLPGAFNSACSTLFGGSYADVYITKAAKDDWAQGADNVGLAHDEAVTIFKAGLAAYGTDEQVAKINATNSLSDLKCVSEERLGLEIVAIEAPTETANQLYAFISKREGLKNYVYPMGRLICKRWKVPFEAPVDLPKHLMDAKADMNEEFDFLVEAETLNFCVPGMKMEAMVKELDLGIKWLDSVEVVYPTFFVWVANERILAWKESGPPTEWMARQMAKRKGLADPKERGVPDGKENIEPDGEDGDEDWPD